MSPIPAHLDPVRARADAANAAIRALYARAQAELRRLTPEERAEYERLREVYLEAVLAA